MDWRITEKRAELLEAAFNCLKKRFQSRKTVFAIIVMASNVLAYIRKKGESRVPLTVDFLKEAMAHIVTFYEDPRLDPENDKKIFKSIYRRFTLLKEKIHDEHQPAREPGLGAASFIEEQSPEKILKDAASQSLLLQKACAAMQREDMQQQPAGQTSPAADQPREMDRETVEALVRELKDSLQKAEELGTTIRHLLVELVSKQQLVLPAMESFLQKAQRIGGTNDAFPVESFRAVPAIASPAGIGEAAAGRQKSPRTPCDRTELVLLRLGEQPVAVEARFITARRTIQEAKRPLYLKNSSVPLKDFRRFLQGLASQFRGCLAKLKNSKLRDLSLPLLTPRGMNIPDKPMETGHEMVVLCNDNWCGILFCSPADPGQAVMVATRQRNDGDLWKTAFLEDDREVPLLNCVELLQREGNMILV